MQRTWLESFRQSRAVVFVVVGAYSFVICDRTRQLRCSTSRDDAGSMNFIDAHSGPLLTVAGTEAGESPPVSGDAPLPLGGDTPPDKGSLTAPGKGFAGYTAPDRGAAAVSESLLVRLRIGQLTPALADRPTRHWCFRV